MNQADALLSRPPDMVGSRTSNHWPNTRNKQSIGTASTPCGWIGLGRRLAPVDNAPATFHSKGGACLFLGHGARRCCICCSQKEGLTSPSASWNESPCLVYTWHAFGWLAFPRIPQSNGSEMVKPTCPAWGVLTYENNSKSRHHRVHQLFLKPSDFPCPLCRQSICSLADRRRHASQRGL